MAEPGRNEVSAVSSLAERMVAVLMDPYDDGLVVIAARFFAMIPKGTTRIRKVT